MRFQGIPLFFSDVVLAKRGIPISTIIKRKVNSGEDTLFLKNEWICHKSLQLVFPDLYCLESHKKCKISDRIYDGGISWSWYIQPDPYHVNQLSQIFQSTCLNSSNDSWSCELDSNGQFSVAACRSRLKLDRMFLQKFRVLFGGQFKITSPLHWLSRIRESILHRLRVVNRSQLNTYCVYVTLPKLLGNGYLDGVVFRCPHLIRNCPKKKKVLVGICYGTMWCLWKAINDRTFNQSKIASTKVVDMVLSSVFMWFKHRSNNKVLNG
uniref:Reverse transcriptase zinc-binding domain-containing protein n=1 Tax=Lactuca sativa TaxID=4236 RepID=A0A9R1VBE7_LACSA|nr:hypothetical protein LSAT_V11C500267890 [Lactuca sativa]